VAEAGPARLGQADLEVTGVTAMRMEDGFLTTSQGQIAVRRIRPETHDPAAPAILLLHEALGAISMWRDFPEALARRFGREVIAWDRLGHGRSDPFPPGPRGTNYHKDIAWGETAELIAALDLSAPPILFGHSDGATIALVYAARHPVAAVIAEAGHILVDARTIAGLRIARRAWQETDLPQRLARHHGDKTEALFRAWNDTWLRPDYADWSVADVVGDVQAPCLVIQGAEDDYAVPEHVGWIVDALSGPAEGELLANCRHIPHLERAEAVIDRMAVFLTRHGLWDGS